MKLQLLLKIINKNKMNKIMSYTSAVFAPIFVLVLVFTMANVASAVVDTAPGLNKLQCFDGTTDGGYNGVCTLKSNGAKGPATLNNVDEDTDPYNNYSGVYVLNSNLIGDALGEVTQLSFNYSGDAATAGSPRFALPVDIDGNGSTDGYLFISAFYCNHGAGNVNVITDETCTIYTNFSVESFENWADLVATHPDWTVGTATPFIIADEPGVWTISNVKLGKGGK